jgi:(E)-4-hydroxy-3-methylbut-2-enyl-diphosphate synthase
VGLLQLGGGAPVLIQEMTSTPTEDVEATLRQISGFTALGCRLVRVAVPGEEAARAISRLKAAGVPLVADIHYDYRLALLALKAGADKLRINPGTMGAAHLPEIVAAARERSVPIRVGVNSGSLERRFAEKFGGVTALALVESALEQAGLLETHGFQDIVVSIKSPDIGLTVEANTLLARRCGYPIHIGITESGFGEPGTARSVIGLGLLLQRGIGDTVRVSLTSTDRRENLRVCVNTLRKLGIAYQ